MPKLDVRSGKQKLWETAMTSMIHRITLETQEPFCGRLPTHEVGLLLAELPGAVRSAVSMIFRNRSSLSSQPPAWLERAADIRFVDFSRNGTTELFLEAPTLNDDADERNGRAELGMLHVDRADTGIDLLGDVLVDLARKNEDSEKFDVPLLHRLLQFEKVFEHRIVTLLISGRRREGSGAALLSPEILNTAKRFSDDTPPSQRSRLVGIVDKVHVGTQTFEFLLASGEKIPGVTTESLIDSLMAVLGRKILVFGKAVYRASGRLLRIEAEAFRPATEQDGFFAVPPKAHRVDFDLRSPFRERQEKPGVQAILGKWPGDETDEQIERALRELS